MSKLRNYNDVKSVGIRIDQDGKRIWINIDGCCVLRVYEYTQLRVTDDRKREKSPKVEHPKNRDHNLPTSYTSY